MTATGPQPIERISALDRDAFVALLGGVFEHSPWVAEQAYEARPFTDAESLRRAMVQAMRAGGRERHLALIRAHPELAGKAAERGTLTAESTAEQASAGLDRCTPEELATLRELNSAYGKRFGFPFIMAVKGRSRAEVLDAMRARLDNDPDTELERCLSEIETIAGFRLRDLVVP